MTNHKKKYGVLAALILASLVFSTSGVLAQTSNTQGVLPSNSLELSVTKESDPAPTVEEFVTEGLKHSPSVEALRARLQAAQYKITPAGAFPDPMLELAVQDMGLPKIGPNSTASLEVRQDLPYPGKRKARREAAKASAFFSAAELEDLRRRIISQIRTLYAQIYTEDCELRTLREANELMNLLVAAVMARYSSGLAEQESVLKAQLEVSRISERLSDLESDRKELVASLNRLLDRPGDQFVEEINHLPPAAALPQSFEQQALANSAEIAMKRAAIEEARHRLEEAKLDRLPDFSVGVGGGIDGMIEPLVMLRFGIGLPIWQKQKQQPLVLAAEKELQAAQMDLRDVEAEVRAETAKLTAKWHRNEEQIRRYKEAIGPQSHAAMEAARASYLAGRGDFSTVMEDFNRWLEARVQLARREADRFITWAEIEALATPAQDSIEKGEKP